PAHSQQFATPQSCTEGQKHGREEPMLRDGRQERRRDLVESERRHLPVGRAWPDRQCTHIARYELILDRLFQGAIHKDMERLHRLGVEPPRATYAAHLDLIIVEPLEMLWPEILEQEVPEGWLEMSTDERLVGIKRGGPDLGLLVVVEPRVEPFPNSHFVRC